jgi:hypothetical protein
LFGRRYADDHTGPLAEYVALRAEIVQHVDLQWKTTVILLTSTGAVFGFALSSAGRLPLLLIAPYSSYILCTRWLHSQALIERAACYIRTRLDVKVPGGLGWEQWLIAETPNIGLFRQALHKARTRPTALTYPGLSLLALATVAVWFLASVKSWSYLAVLAGAIGWSIGLLLTFSCIWLIWQGHRHRAKLDLTG